eukprot:4151586-Amphidinium_carterae.1
MARATNQSYSRTFERALAHKRRFNRSMLERLDKALLATTGIGLARFLSKNRPIALLSGERREVRTVEVKGMSLQRSVVVSADGQARVEVPRRSVSD